MAEPETLRLYLDPAALTRVRGGQHNFFARLIGAVEGAGWRVEVLESTLANRLAAPGRDGYALYHMEAPTHERALTCRRCYVGAFWHIEARVERWRWPVAKEKFRPDKVDGAAAERFAAMWRKRLFPEVASPEDKGFIFVPLQGRLLTRRGFQWASPVEMLDILLTRTDRPVKATLHPAETYTEEELSALDALTRRFPRLSVSRGNSGALLRGCHMVATENSGLAAEGYFIEKPALLFARAEFHHIAASVPREGMEAAFDPHPMPDYARYLSWFFQLRAINAGRSDCEERILAVLRGHGWPI